MKATDGHFVRRARLRWRLLRRAWRRRKPAIPAGAAAAALPLLLVAFAGAWERDGEPIPSATSPEPTWTAADRALAPLQRQRAEAVRTFAGRYGVPDQVAGRIYDAARDQALDPELAFRLVRVESSFRERAVSPKGAVGYTQVLPSTARWLQPGLETEELFEPETNLRLGFGYLRMLLQRYDNDARLALLAYNRGPGTVAALLAMGEDPANGYAARVLGRAAPTAAVEPATAPTGAGEPATAPTGAGEPVATPVRPGRG